MNPHFVNNPMPFSDSAEEASPSGSQDIETGGTPPLSREAQANLWRYIDHLERWRQSIGFEIHDGLTQQITAALLFLESYQREQPDPTTLERCRAILEEALAESRRLIQGLSPKKLDDEGIEAALAEFLTVPSVSLATVELEVDAELPSLSPWQRTTLFRFLQECITNARKHSEASKIAVSLHQQDGQLVGKVIDNGIGFDLETVKLVGYGMRSLQQKADLLSGELTIESAPGKGSEITLRLPIAAK